MINSNYKLKNKRILSLFILVFAIILYALVLICFNVKEPLGQYILSLSNYFIPAITIYGMSCIWTPRECSERIGFICLFICIPMFIDHCVKDLSFLIFSICLFLVFIVFIFSGNPILHWYSSLFLFCISVMIIEFFSYLIQIDNLSKLSYAIVIYSIIIKLMFPYLINRKWLLLYDIKDLDGYLTNLYKIFYLINSVLFYMLIKLVNVNSEEITETINIIKYIDINNTTNFALLIGYLIMDIKWEKVLNV